MIPADPTTSRQRIKKWLTMRDDRVCRRCQQNADAEWIDFYRPFPSGHHKPPAHTGCRCGLMVSLIGLPGKILPPYFKKARRE